MTLRGALGARIHLTHLLHEIHRLAARAFDGVGDPVHSWRIRMLRRDQRGFVLGPLSRRNR